MKRVLRLAILLLAAPLGAQDDPVETHLYDVDTLVTGVPDFPGEAVGLASDPIGTALSTGEEYRQPLPAEELIALIRANIAPATWEQEGIKIEDIGGSVAVTHRRSVHAKIGPYVDYWRAFHGRFVTLDAEIVSADPAFAAQLRAAGDPDRPSVLSVESMRKLLDAARDGKQADLLRSMRLTVQPGQRVSLQEFTRQSYVRDYDVQIAAAASELDPVVDVLSTGPSVDVRVHLEPAGGVTIEARLDSAELDSMGERKIRLSKEYMTNAALPAEPGKAADLVKGPVFQVPVERKLQLPAIHHDRVRTTLTVRDRESAVVASLSRKNRTLLYVLTPGVVMPADLPAAAPAGEGERVLRIFDVSSLTRGVQDYAGPMLDLASPARGGGGPLTGAVFTLDEPSHFMDSGRIEEQIRSRFAPGTWGENDIKGAHSDQLLVYHKPAVLKQVDEFLNALIAARARTIATEAVLVGFKKGARAPWEKAIPALAPGGYYTDTAAVDKLLDEARRGQGVRIVAATEVTGLPQQRVHAFAGREENYIQDYEPQVSAYASAMDPIIGVFMTGFVLDVRPAFVKGADRISVEFRASYSAGETGEIDALGGGTGVIQTVKAKVLKWAQNVVCEKGKYSVIATGRLGAGDEMEDVAVFLRCRVNNLK